MSITFATFSSCTTISLILSSINLSFIEIGWLWVNSSLVHVKLIDLNGIPIVEISSWLVQYILTRISSHSVNVVRYRSYSCPWLEIRLWSFLITKILIKPCIAKICTSRLLGKISLWWFSILSKHLVLTCKLIYLQIFLFHNLVIHL